MRALLWAYLSLTRLVFCAFFYYSLTTSYYLTLFFTSICGLGIGCCPMLEKIGNDWLAIICCVGIPSQRPCSQLEKKSRAQDWFHPLTNQVS